MSSIFRVISMNNAYECEEEFGKGGHCIKRKRSVGAIVPWAIVAGLGLYTGHATGIPSVFWNFFQK